MSHDDLKNYIEMSNLFKNLSFYLEMIDGENENILLQLIYQTALEFKIEYLFESVREQLNVNKEP